MTPDRSGLESIPDTIDRIVREKVDAYLADRLAYHLPHDFVSLARNWLAHETTERLLRMIADEVEPFTVDEDASPDYRAGWNAARDECLSVLDGHMQWLRESSA